jgi:hypothetical protein
LCAEPFAGGGRRVQISKHVFETNEAPRSRHSFFVDFGSMLVLPDPAYPKLSKSLKAVLDDKSCHSAVARALIANHLWHFSSHVC